MRATTPVPPEAVDAIREIANIGSGHAATALSQMTEMPVTIDVPEVYASSLPGVHRLVAGEDESVIVLTMRMLGDLTGETWFLLRERNASMLCDLLLHRPPGSGQVFGPLEVSSLKEAGNIMAGSFLNALSVCFGDALLPSVPHLSLDRVPDATTVHSAESVLAVITNFRFEGELDPHELKGVFLFALDRPSLERLMVRLHTGFCSERHAAAS